MKNIAICDDKEDIHRRVTELLHEFYLETEVNIFDYYSGEEILDSSDHFDIIFMDIELVNLNGIETSREIRKTDLDVFIVIISGYEDYKSKGYSVHAFDYLDKPIDKVHFFEVLQDIDKTKYTRKCADYVTFKSTNSLLKLNTDDIFYFEYYERRIKIETLQGTFYFYENLGEVASRMLPYVFAMPHRAYIVNFYHITRINKYDIVLDNSDIIPISRNRVLDFKKEYNHYLGKITERR